VVFGCGSEFAGWGGPSGIGSGGGEYFLTSSGLVWLAVLCVGVACFFSCLVSPGPG